MALGSGSGKRQSGGSGFAPDLDVNDWYEQPSEPRDVKKLFLVAGLGILSWVATYVGMLELIEANMGDLPLVHKAIIGFSVAMLMTMVIWLLDQLFAPIGAFTKVIYAAGYLFLTVISVGFGFGFYWKVLESRSEASRSAEGAVGQVQTALFAASTRLDQLHQTLDGLTTMSAQKAGVERASGTSCPNSKPGDGPRRKLRDDDAARFKFASEFVQGRVGAVKGEMTALNADLAKILTDDKSIVDAKSGTRNEFMKALSRKLDLTVTGFNAFRSDPQLKQIRTDLAERAERATFPDTKGATFNCPDPQLSTALKGVVRAIDELPVLEKPKIAAVEGSEATIEAFRRLTATFYGLLSFKMPPSADELRELQKKAVQSVEMTPAQAAAQQRLMSSDGVGLSKRDYVPLAIALFVDICLLLVSMRRPMNRLGALVPKMRDAERGPVIQILSRFNDIHRDPEIRRNFEVFRHVVFDFHGDYYVAVPLDAPFGVGQRMGRNGRPEYYSQSPTDLADHQVEAHILANLFTSFEKERIFARVYSPFLTTRTIQKRLARQGSKFAHAKAFRIYRFRDGAWSEIILGAVMGAARRVEADKRSRNLMEGHRLPSAPPQAAPQQHQPLNGAQGATMAGQPPRGPHVADPVAGHVGGHAVGNQTAASAHVRGPVASPPNRRPSPLSPSEQGATGAAVAAASVRASAPNVSATLGNGAAVRADQLPPDHVDRFGPYAAHVAPPASRHAPPAGSTAPLHPETQVAMAQHANNNTQPNSGSAPERRQNRQAVAAVAAAAAAAAATTDVERNVIPLPGVRTVDSVIPDTRPSIAPVAPEETVTYELRRETLTATVPVSQAALPEALLARLRRQDGQSAHAALVAAPEGASQAEVEIMPDAHPALRDMATVTEPPALPPPAVELAARPHALDPDEVSYLDDDSAAEEVIVLGPSPEELTDDERATLARFATARHQG